MGAHLEYNILNIQTSQFATFDTPTLPSKGELRMDTKWAYGIDIPQKRVKAMLDVTIFLSELPFIKIATEATYELSTQCFNSFMTSKSFILPVETVIHFSSEVYGTTRGILLCKLEDAGKSKFILPPIDLSGVISEPLEVEISSEDSPIKS